MNYLELSKKLAVLGKIYRMKMINDSQYLSMKTQIKYYTDKIKANKDWVFAGIYADEATTGTKVEKREEFQKRKLRLSV